MSAAASTVRRMSPLRTRKASVSASRIRRTSSVSCSSSATTSLLISTVLSGSFADPGTLDAHTVVISWGDGTSDTTLNLAAGVLTFSAPAHTFLNNRVANAAYSVGVSVTDACIGWDETQELLLEAHGRL